MLARSDFELPNESLEMLDMIMDIEDEYNILISDSEAASITSKEDLIELVEKKLREKDLI